MPYGPSKNARGAGNYGQQVVQFTLQDAQRISAVVHEVEHARRDANPSFLPRAVGSGGGGLDIVSGRLRKTTLDTAMATWPAGVTLGVGHAVSLSSNYASESSRTLYPADLQVSLGNTTNINTALTSITTASLTWPSTAVSSVSLLPELEKTTSSRWLDLSSIGSTGETFGVISSIESDATYYYVKLIVGGVFLCRLIAYGIGTRVVGPPPYSGSAEIKSVWRPYPMMSAAGAARIISFGSYYQVGSQPWPRIYEAIVRL